MDLNSIKTFEIGNKRSFRKKVWSTLDVRYSERKGISFVFNISLSILIFLNTIAIILNTIQGKNSFVLMPTGAGKSLCYQLPAIVMDGTAIVISPLIALMKNQVDQMVAFGINAQFLNSSLTRAEINRVKAEVISGAVKLLYIAPESLNKQENLNFLKQAKISFVAIDEAHCISCLLYTSDAADE